MTHKSAQTVYDEHQKMAVELKELRARYDKMRNVIKKNWDSTGGYWRAVSHNEADEVNEVLK